MNDVLTALIAHDTGIAAADRIELKRTRSGHYRLYFPAPHGMTKQHVSAIVAVLANLAVTVNPFGSGGRIKAITIVDDAEDAPNTTEA